MKSLNPLIADVNPRPDNLAARTEELQDVLAAEARLEDIRAGRTQTAPLADMMKRYFP